jgi:hypothetical protein
MAWRRLHLRASAAARSRALVALVRRLGVFGVCLLVDACAATPVPQNPFRQGDAAPANTDRSAPDPSRSGASRGLTDSVVLLASSPDDLAPSLVGRALRHLAKNLRLLALWAKSRHSKRV